MFRLRPSFAALCLAALGTTLAPREADACGGCFHPIDQAQSTVVTAHRMALSVSKTQTVLWDQIKYAGSPKEFAWVLPVKAGATVEVASDAFFEALDAATSEHVSPPQLDCPRSSGSGCGCAQADAMAMAGSASASGGPAVTVVHQGTVGPYETVTLHANEQGALVGWLQNHGFAIDAAEQPIVDAYSGEGFDFIALRLQPGASVAQMTPVRVVTEGAEPTLPLRMVGVGTGAEVAITLYVIGEGRWEARNFPNVELHGEPLVWDFDASRSSYAELRKGLLAQGDGRTWLTTFAKKGVLLSPVPNPLERGVTVTYATTDQGPYYYGGYGADAIDTIAQLYLQQGRVDAGADASTASECVTRLESHANDDTLVNDGKDFACEDLDDLAVAFRGLHPRDVWVTRLEATLPRAALADDLAMTAASAQTPVENWHLAKLAVNADCPLMGSAAPLAWDRPSPRKPSGTSQRWAAMAAAVAAIAGALGRRAARRRAAVG